MRKIDHLSVVEKKIVMLANTDRRSLLAGLTTVIKRVHQNRSSLRVYVRSSHVYHACDSPALSRMRTCLLGTVSTQRKTYYQARHKQELRFVQYFLRYYLCMCVRYSDYLWIKSRSQLFVRDRNECHSTLQHTSSAAGLYIQINIIYN